MMIDKDNLINNTQSYKGVWILAEVAGKAIDKVSFELLSRGRQLADARSAELSAVVLGWGIKQSDLEELIARGADKVIFVESPQLEHFLIEPHSACLLELIKQYRPEIFIAAATTTGRTLMPYLAVRARAGLTADCTELKIDEETGGLLQIRPAIGGNVLATIITPAARPQMATVRPRSTKPAPIQKGRTGEIVRINPPADLLKSRLQRLGFEPDQSTQSIQDADIIVAVGRGIGNARNIRIVEELADALGAAIGASRERKKCIGRKCYNSRVTLARRDQRAHPVVQEQLHLGRNHACVDTHQDQAKDRIKKNACKGPQKDAVEKLPDISSFRRMVESQALKTPCTMVQ